MKDFYYTDRDIGLSRETSHPRFVEIANQDFYYNACDDFSPFGSDDGSDVLFMLEEWFKAGGRPYGVIRFLRATIESWGLNVPRDIARKTHKGIMTWLKKNRMNDTFLISEARLRVAVGFGEMKICGKIDKPILREAQLGLNLLHLLNERSKTEYPNWQYRDLDFDRLNIMVRDLNKMTENK